jgi:hypothetical protein
MEIYDEDNDKKLIRSETMMALENLISLYQKSDPKGELPEFVHMMYERNAQNRERAELLRLSFQVLMKEAVFKPFLSHLFGLPEEEDLTDMFDEQRRLAERAAVDMPDLVVFEDTDETKDLPNDSNGNKDSGKANDPQENNDVANVDGAEWETGDEDEAQLATEQQPTQEAVTNQIVEQSPTTNSRYNSLPELDSLADDD